MALFSTLVPDIQVLIPELPGFTVERELTRAAREFCEKTRAWRVNIQISTTASVATVDISSLLPTGSELVDVISVKNIEGGQPVVPRTYAWLDENTSDWRSEEALDAQWYVLSDNDTLQLVYTPSTTVANQYDARVAVKPLVSAATTVDVGDVVMNKYDEVLIDGALQRLFAMPRKPWTDLNLSAYHGTRFVNEIPAARTEAAEEFQTGVARKVKYGGL